MKRLAACLILMPAMGSAAEVVQSPSASAVRYSWVVVDSRKLKTTLASALNQLPGEECVGFADLAPVVCPGMTFTAIFGYNSVGSMGMPVPVTTDDRGRTREAKVDGLKVKRWLNWDPATQKRLVHVSFASPVTEFGFDFLPTLDGIPTEQLTYGFEVTVNGVYLGYFAVPPQVGFLGVRAAPGETLHDVSIRAIPETQLPEGGESMFYGGTIYVR